MDTAVTISHTFTAYGTSFRLNGDDSVVLERACRLVRTLKWTDAVDDGVVVTFELRGRRPNAAQADSFDLSCDGELVHHGTGLEELLDAFENYAKLKTALHAKDCLFVHAGVVSWRGAAIVLPGRSRAGKTTFVRELIQAGAEYYSDEFAVLDGCGQVHPYGVPLSLRGRLQTRITIHPEQLGARVGAAAIPIALILVTEYRRGARWRPRSLSRGEALLALMDNTVAARQSPERTMPILREAVLHARAIQSQRGDARMAAHHVLAEWR